MTPALIMQFIALAIQYGPELGIDVKNTFDRLNSGENVADLIAELDTKRNDLPPLSFGE